MFNRALPLLLVVPLLCPAEDAAGWQALEQLNPGTLLRIDTSFRQNCRLVQVTDSALECAGLRRIDEQFVFGRGEVHQIRLMIRKPNHRLRNTLIAAAVGEALGILWGHAGAGSDPVGSDPALLAIYGLPVAAVFGASANTISGGVSFGDGPIIYRAPRNP